jgi:eukaryotic-like serine/threonine-protein kinase
VSSTTNHHEGELASGQMLGRYELLMPIATGGMGTVWAARLKGTRGFKKLVAIKTILRSFENSESERMLFSEAVLASQIHHPNVAETLELGEQDGVLYLVMELVSGESLSFLLKEAHKRGGVPFPVAVNLVGQVCRGLQAAHELRDENGQRVGLVHRDISPPNVLVTDSGTVKIVDFGVATTTSSATYGSGEIKGKISYLAPEQLRGEPVDARVDVFTTGILLYLLTVGRHPFRADGEAATVARILSDTPAAPPSALLEYYPEALEAVVLRALDKRKDTRFPSALAFLEALQRAVPDAFGPRADSAVTVYVKQLMSERLAERRTTLRLAEDLAERSVSRDSVRSVTAVVAPSFTPAPRRSHRTAWVGIGALFVGLGSAAAAVPAYFTLIAPPQAVPVAVAAVAPPMSHLPGRSAPATTEAAPEPLDIVAAPEARRRAISRAGTTQRTARNGGEAAVTDDEYNASLGEFVDRLAAKEPAEPAAMPESGLDAGVPLPVEAPRVPPALPMMPRVAALSPAPYRQIEPAPAGPRVLPSKIGHGLLRINPNSDAYRVRPPGALDRSGQAFKATVKICVDANGGVSNVSVLRSAGPAIDSQIPAVLSRWRYRPFLEAGRPTPFCYTLAYEISH